VTAIVGLVDRGAVWLGGDSGCFSGWNRDTLPEGKLFRLGPCIIGLSGYAKDSQVIQYFVEPPKLEGDLKTWVITKFAPLVRKAWKEHGCTTVKDGVESAQSDFLLGVRDKLFRISGNLYVGDRDDPYQAIGCGQDFALGVLHASRGAPQARLQRALEAATYFSSGVYPPFTFLTTKGDK